MMKHTSLLAVLFTLAGALVVTGCAVGPSKSANATEHGNGTGTANAADSQNNAAGSGNAPAGSSNTANNTSTGENPPSHPTLLNIVNKGTLSLSVSASSLNQNAFDVQTPPDFLNRQEGFVATPKGLSYTSNGGQTWTPISSPGGNVEALHFTSPDAGWVVTATGSPNSGSPQSFTLYETVNAGSRWIKEWSRRGTGGISDTRIFSFGQQGQFAVVADELLRRGTSGWTPVTMPISGQVMDADFVTAQLGWVVMEQKQKAASPNDAPKITLVVLKTQDGGSHWSVQLRAVPFLGGEATLSFGSTNNGLLLYKNTATMNTIEYRTTNGGDSWTKSTPSQLSGRVWAERPVFGADGSVWIALSAGAAPFPGSVEESADMGKTWHTLTVHNEWRLLMMSHRFGDTAYAIAGLNQGYAVLKTTDNGKTWRQMLPAVSPTISVSFLSPTVGYALGTESNDDAVLKTTDGGSTWTTVGFLPAETQVYDIAFVSDSVGYVTVYPSRSTNGSKNIAVLETRDGGKTWTTATVGELPQSVVDGINQNANIVEPIYFLPPTKSGGKDWVLGTTGYPTLYTVVAGDSGADTTGMGAGEMSAGGAGSGSGGAGSGSGGAGSGSGGAGSGGSAVVAKYADPPGAIEAYSFLSPTDGWMSLLKTKKSGSAGGQTTILELDNKHQEWIPKWILGVGWSVQGMDRLNAKDAWLLCQYPSASNNPTLAVYRTTDGGQTWTRYEEPKGPDLMTPHSDAFPLDFVNQNDGWLLTGQGLFKTTDGGATWRTVSK